MVVPFLRCRHTVGGGNGSGGIGATNNSRYEASRESRNLKSLYGTIVIGEGARGGGSEDGARRSRDT